MPTIVSGSDVDIAIKKKLTVNVDILRYFAILDVDLMKISTAFISTVDETNISGI